MSGRLGRIWWRSPATCASRTCTWTKAKKFCRRFAPSSKKISTSRISPFNSSAPACRTKPVTSCRTRFNPRNSSGFGSAGFSLRYEKPLHVAPRKLILRFDAGWLVVNLYCSSAGFIHLLGGVAIEVRYLQCAANAFRRHVLQLRANDREYRREQNAPVSSNQNEIAHITDRRFCLKRGSCCGKISRVVPRVRGLLRWNWLLNHDNLRLRLRFRNRLLRRLLLLLIVAHLISVIGVIGIPAEQDWHERSLLEMMAVSEAERTIVQGSADRRQVREIESQTRHARVVVEAERIGNGSKPRGDPSSRRNLKPAGLLGGLSCGGGIAR